MSFFVIGNHPLLCVGDDVGDSGSCVDVLTFLDGASSKLAVAWCNHHGVRQVELSHFEGGLGALDGCLGVAAACLHLVHARQGSLLLTLNRLQLLAGGAQLGLNLLELYRSGSLAFNKVFIAYFVLLEFCKTNLNFANRRFVNRCRVACGHLGGVDYVGSRLSIFERSLGVHHAYAIFAVVEHQQRVALLHVLVFGEVHLLNITCGAHIHRRQVLFDLSIVAGFGFLIVEK